MPDARLSFYTQLSGLFLCTCCHSLLRFEIEIYSYFVFYLKTSFYSNGRGCGARAIGFKYSKLPLLRVAKERQG